MKELRTYISEGFFSNVGADVNNDIKRAIDIIKDASMNNVISSIVERQINERRKFTKLLASILEDVENDMKKGKLIFKYDKNDGTCIPHEVIITLEMTGSNNARWAYRGIDSKFGWLRAYDIAFNITMDLYYEAFKWVENPKHYHSIAKTIKIVEIKLS